MEPVSCILRPLKLAIFMVINLVVHPDRGALWGTSHDRIKVHGEELKVL